MKIYTVMDMDMNYIFGAYKTFNGVFQAARGTMEDCLYQGFEFKNGDQEGEWYITFPHSDPQCVGHWQITEIEVEE